MAMEKQGTGEKKKARRLTSEQQEEKKEEEEDGAVRCFHANMEQERRVFFSIFSTSSSSC